MITYLVKMVLCSAALLLVYYLLLVKEKMHRFNRYYLLLSLIFALVVPFIEVKPQMPVKTDNEASETIFSVTETTFKTVSDAIEEPVHHIDIWPNLLLATYLLISVILLIRFARNLFQIWLKVKNSEKVLHQNAQLVLLPQSIVSHSFLKYIFIAKDDYDNGAIDEAILNHELAHVQQKHSLDILFVEAVSIIFWFNPLVYFYKKVIQINHEFLADTAALETYNDVASYQYLLLAQANKPAFNQLASQFNFLITKKRLLMMNTTTSFTRKIVKQLAILPIIGSLVFVFSSKTIAQDTLKKLTDKISIKQPIKDSTVKKLTPKELKVADSWAAMSIGYSKTDASSEVMKEYETIVNKYKSSSDNKYGIKLSENLSRNQDDMKRLAILFKQMSKEQQYRQNIVFCKPLGPFKREVPTETQFNNFKKANIYGVWIDDKRVANNVLEKYTNTDFAHVFVSKLSKTAINYGKHYYQVDLMTKAYYQKYYNESIAKKDEPMMVTRFIRGVTVVAP